MVVPTSGSDPQSVYEGRNRPDILDGDCSDRVNHAVVEEVRRIIPHQFNSTNLEAADEQIEEEQRTIEKYYAWTRTLPDEEIRSCYIHWLGYYQCDLDNCRTEAASRAGTAFPCDGERIVRESVVIFLIHGCLRTQERSREIWNGKDIGMLFTSKCLLGLSD